MANSFVPIREPATRRLCAIVTIAAFGWSGCAVHTWQPAPSERLGGLEGKTVRVVGTVGDLEIKVVRYSHPLLTGRIVRGAGRVHVDLPPQAAVEVLRCGLEATAAPRPSSGRRGQSVPDPSRLIGCDVQFDSGQGLVALGVEGVAAPREVFGRWLAVSCPADGRSCRTGLVRVDVRESSRVDEQRLDQGRSVAKTLAVVLVGSLAAFGVLVGLYAIACATDGCD